jgi:hypothetical protein
LHIKILHGEVPIGTDRDPTLTRVFAETSKC